MTENNILFDKRVIDRNIDKGLISQTDVDERLNQLSDMEQKSELLVLDSEELAAQEIEDNPPQEEESLNFDTPENSGPKNVYDF